MGGFFSKEDNASPISMPEPNPTIVSTDNTNLILMFRYIGTGYHGLQYQCHSKTIAGDLFEGLIKSGILPPGSEKNRGKLNWDEASKTDSGVHACCQLVTFSVRNAKGLKLADVPKMINDNLPKDSPIHVYAAISMQKRFPLHEYAEFRHYEFVLPLYCFASTSASHLKYLRDEICPLFEGRKNYHNYTKNVPARHNSAWRQITKFTFGDPIKISGEKFVVFQIQGYSFMLNQIRKMVAMTLAASHEKISPEGIKRTLSIEDWKTPLLPGDGLLLHFIGYPATKSKRKTCDATNDIEFLAYRGLIEKWKTNVLYKHIAELEKEKKIFLNWVNNVLVNFDVVPLK